jgi:transposase
VGIRAARPDQPRVGAPIPASSGKVTRRRLNPGGNREASHALWRIVITRMSSWPCHPRLRQPAHQGGPVQKEIIRCLKRYVAREVYPTCVPPLNAPDPGGGLTR